MHKLHSLKDKFLKELNEYGDRASFSPSDVETVRNLISSINKICEYIDAEEDKEEYSNRMSYRRGGSYNSYDGSYDGSYGSYARGRMRAKRDSMGRYSREDGYSRDGDMMAKLYEVMEEAPEHKKHEIKQMIEKLERM